MKNIILLTAVMLTGCVGVKQEPILYFDIDKLNTLPYHTLCQEYNSLSKQGRLTVSSRPQLENVLKEKGLSDKDFSMAKEGKIYVGMSQCGLYVSWGRPSKENTYVNKSGKQIQHIYRFSGTKRSYVYTVNGKITSLQN